MLLRATGVFVVAFVVTWVVTRQLIPLLTRRGVLDVPNDRSSHSVATPRGGGIGIVAGLAAGTALALLVKLPLPGAEYFLGCAIVALAGLIDDRRGGLPVMLRLAIQLVAAAMIMFRAGGIERLPLPAPLDLPLGFAAIPLALVWLVGVINLYNFLDGIDGFAGLQGALAGLGLALFSNSGALAAAGLALAGACGGFLVYNWHPAKVFMGDVGSGTLGFALAALPFQLEKNSRGDAIFVVSICLWFFLADGVFTILRRLSLGEKIWQPHRSHLYQRLVKTGLPHDRVALKVLGVAAVLGLLAIASARNGGSNARWSVLVLAMACFLAYYLWTLRRESALRRNY